MKTHLILMVLACMATACGHAQKSAQQQQPAMEEMADVAQEKQPLCGGFTEQRTPTEDETLLFDKVTEKLVGVKYTPESVATQVVAGMNYRFICTAKTATRNPETYQAEITIFRPLPGRGDPKITEIKRL